MQHLFYLKQYLFYTTYATKTKFNTKKVDLSYLKKFTSTSKKEAINFSIQNALNN